LFKLRNIKFENSNKFSEESTISVEAAKALTGMTFGREAKLVGWLQGRRWGGGRAFVGLLLSHLIADAHSNHCHKMGMCIAIKAMSVLCMHSSCVAKS
jgi:hypothetical protein